jgi:hypothetical protein
MINKSNRVIKKLIVWYEKMSNKLLFLIYWHQNMGCQLNLTFTVNKHKLKTSHLFNDILIRADTYFLLPLQKKYYKAIRDNII